MWETQTVDWLGDVGFTPSLAFNDYGSGFPSIAYFNNSIPGSLLFIEDPPGAAVPEPAAATVLLAGALLWCALPRLSRPEYFNGSQS
jgi:hypothetical protein